MCDARIAAGELARLAREVEETNLEVSGTTEIPRGSLWHVQRPRDARAGSFSSQLRGPVWRVRPAAIRASHTTGSNIFVTIPYRKVAHPGGYWGRVFRIPNIMKWIVTTEDGTKYTFRRRGDHARIGTGSGKSSDGLYSYPRVIVVPHRNPFARRRPSRSATPTTSGNITRDERARDHRHLRERAGALWVPPNRRADDDQGLHSQSYHSCQTAGDDHVGRSYDHLFHTSLRDDARSPLNSDPGSVGPSITGSGCAGATVDSITMRTPEGVFQNGSIRVIPTVVADGRLTLLNVYEKTPSGIRLPPYSFTYDGPTMPLRYRTGRTIIPAVPRCDQLASFALDFWATTTARVTATARATPHPYRRTAC